MNVFTKLKTWITDTLKSDSVKHVGWIYSARMTSAFLRLGASVVVARVLGTERLGLLTICAVIMGLSAKLLELGLTTTMVRKVSHYIGQGDDETAIAVFKRVFLFQIQISIVGVVAGWFLAPVIAVRIYENAELITPVRLAFFGALAANVWIQLDGVLRAHERFKQIAIIEVSSQVARTSFILLLAYVVLTLNVERTMMINISQVLIAFVIASVVVPKGYLKAGTGHKYPLKDVFSYSGWMYLFSLTFLLFDRLDVLMLGYFRAGSEVGVYAVAFRLIIPFEMIPETFNTVFLPKVSKYTERLQIVQYFRNTLKFTGIVGVLGVVMVLVSRPLILTLYGDEYEASVKLFQILVGAFVLLTILNPLALAAHSINKPQVFVIMAGINLVLNFTGNLIFIPPYGAVGAAVVTLLSRVLGGVLGLLVLKKFLDRWSADKKRQAENDGSES